MANHKHIKNTSHDTLTTQVHAENPEELLHLKLHKPSVSAAGITGVKVALKHVLKEMNVARGAKALFAEPTAVGCQMPWRVLLPLPQKERPLNQLFCSHQAARIFPE